MDWWKGIGDEIDKVNSFIQKEDWDGLNSYIKEAELLPIIICMSKLRAAYPVRSKLPDYTNKVEAFAESLRESGQEEILMGLKI